MSIFTRLITLVLVALVLAACGTTAPPTPSGPHGAWSGNAYVDGYYAGSIAARYDLGTWAWCVTIYDCVVGHTDGWDLVDNYGERVRGTYTGTSVKLSYSYDGMHLTATLLPYTPGQASAAEAGSGAGLHDTMRGLTR